MVNDIVLICLPAHTTKYLQPLDRSVFKPLKVNYDYATNNWMKHSPGAAITKYRFASLFKEAWGKSATVQNAVRGFEACGISPFNPQAIPDEAFTPSETSERTQEVQESDPNVPLESQSVSGDTATINRDATWPKQCHHILFSTWSKPYCHPRVAS